VHIFLIILSQYKNYIDETSSSLSSCFCFCILSNESSTIAPSSRLHQQFQRVFHFFFHFEHSLSLLFFFPQICSFTLHLTFVTITTHLICRSLTLLEIIVCNKFCLNLKITRNKLCLKKINFSFSNR